MEDFSTAFFQRLVTGCLAVAVREMQVTPTIDSDTFEAIKNQQLHFPKRVQTLASWIRAYKVHRVRLPENQSGAIQEAFAERIAACCLQHFDKKPPGFSSASEEFRCLRAAIGNAYSTGAATGVIRERSFLSLTSKVLWCAYPDKTPIFDDYASNALSILKKIEMALLDQLHSARPEIKTRPAPKRQKTTSAESDVLKFTNFVREHDGLYRRVCPYIKEGLDKVGHSNLSSYRLFDKILWVIGNRGYL